MNYEFRAPQYLQSPADWRAKLMIFTISRLCMHESSTCHSSGHLALLQASILKNIGFYGLSALIFARVSTFYGTFEKVDFWKNFLRKPSGTKNLGQPAFALLCLAGRKKSARNSRKFESHQKLELGQKRCTESIFATLRPQKRV